jgi:hypothetical protein
MSLDLEEQLRQSLSRQADTTRQMPTDPWGEFTADERRHRTARRIARGAVGAVAVAGLVAAIGTGVIALPGGNTATTSVTPAAPVPALVDSPTRGSLAQNKTWLKGLRTALTGAPTCCGFQVVEHSPITIVFAGDVPGRRLALVTVLAQQGGTTQTQMLWLGGPVHATPSRMTLMSTFDPGNVVTRMEGTEQDGGYLVVVAPDQATVQTSLGTDRGTGQRIWTPGKDGIAIVAAPPSPSAPAAKVVVTLHGRTLFSDEPTSEWLSGSTPKGSAVPTDHASETNG